MRIHPAILLAATLATAPAAGAQALTIVHVSAPQINCVFAASCSVTVNDLASPILGGGFLQSREFQSEAGSPAAGAWVYQYRVDLTNAAGSLVPAVTHVAVPIAAPIKTLDYNGDGRAAEQVFVITGGALGAVAPTSAWLHGDTVHFTFGTPVQGGASAGGGQSSFFFGLVSPSAPADVGARIESNVDPDLIAPARGPAWMASPGILAPAASPAPRPTPRPRPRPRRP